ncbi:MAG: UDP-glucuronic acid decarboxylase family protein [Nanoarchaeota archaeon]|nr:SDR family oxidoreductase [Nanoarchaeota archaeon]MBU4301062.1 SDR family oxidoreductase [Nanoarchaeota archaeon]MBU4451392.1 SDR family oxidoreductase [Nanoarchaeota archaeon]MCG2724054.1 SDR family oxidoreductase [archaeon]
METIIITGGAGFIGSHLCDALVNNYKVICIDNFITGRRKNVAHLSSNKNFVLIEHDVTKPMKITENVKYIFHLASPASPIDYQLRPIKTMLANSFGAYNMLELAKEKNARILLASTSEVYGDPKEHPQKETYWGNVNPIGPRSCYDESKRFAEALAMSYLKEHKVDIRLARIFNTYGPRMRENDGRVIPNFISQALQNQPITVYGNGSQTRSFCYVSDLVNGLKRFMFKESLSGEVINLGNPEECTILETAKTVKQIIGNSSEISFKELPQDDPLRRNPDISKAKKILSWQPEISFDEGLRKTIPAFKSAKI